MLFKFGNEKFHNFKNEFESRIELPVIIIYNNNNYEFIFNPQNRSICVLRLFDRNSLLNKHAEIWNRRE